jgi:hypothetical protein
MSELKMRRPARWRRKAASTRRRRADVLTVTRDGKVERRQKDKQGSRGNLPCWVSNGRLKSGYAVTFRALLEGPVEVVSAAPSWANSC